jgi:hypothetical protein
MLKQKIKLLVATATACATLLALTPGSAQATSGYGYDGLWADQTSCANDVRTAKSTSVLTQGQLSAVWGKIELRYSPSCRTVWARVTTPTLPLTQAASVVRNSDGKYQRCDGRLWSSTLNSYYCITAMLYDGGVTSYAHANIGRAIDQPLAYGKTGSY